MHAAHVHMVIVCSVQQGACLLEASTECLDRLLQPGRWPGMQLLQLFLPSRQSIAGVSANKVTMTAASHGSWRPYSHSSTNADNRPIPAEV